MGLGDELMMAGEARRAAGGTSRRYCMLDKKGVPRWHFLWEGNPNIAKPGEPFNGVVGYVNGRRHYLVDEVSTQRFFREYQPVPAKIALTDAQKLLARDAAGAIVFNPTVKHGAPRSKDWGLERWKSLVRLAPDLRWLQVGDPSMPRVRGAEVRITANVMDALALLSGARAVVAHEGFLHHAAAAFGVQAVVIRGGFISPRVTGYAGQRDLYVEDERYPLGCGMRVACAHCMDAMASLTPELVLENLREFLKAPA